jgi:RNA polymerase sigma-70 factor (ECF subfamily)
LNHDLVERLYRRAKADRWALPASVFADALAASVGHAFTTPPDARELERYLASLHVEDLALACACASGNDAAWDRFVLEQRPLLYRSADALAPGGGARELADSLYADLYGLDDRARERPVRQAQDRRSLFRYFHGRSSLATWLRAVLAQRFVDRVRSERRFEPLADEDTASAPAAAHDSPDPDRPRFLALVQRALSGAMSRLTPRDRLRLGFYYAQELTLAQTGRLLREHEATVSRQLARTRKIIREEVERELRAELSSHDEVERCLASVSGDAGPLDLGEMLGSVGARKKAATDRSI